jgi:hypothetical protein
MLLRQSAFGHWLQRCWLASNRVCDNEKIRLTVVHGYESSVTFCLNRNSAHVTVLLSTVFPRSPLHLSHRKTSFSIPCWYQSVSCSISHVSQLIPVRVLSYHPCVTADISPCPELSAMLSQLILVHVLSYQPCVTADISPCPELSALCHSWYQSVSWAVSLVSQLIPDRVLSYQPCVMTMCDDKFSAANSRDKVTINANPLFTELYFTKGPVTFYTKSNSR